MSDTVAEPMAEPPRPPPPKPARWLGAAIGVRAPGLKLGFVGGLLLLLLLPQCMVAELINEREARQTAARYDIGASWGQPQTVLGPLVVLPYRIRAQRGPDVWERGTVAIPPAELTADARLAPQRRRLGLFEAVVYTAQIDLAARFALSATLPDSAEPLWTEAYLLTGSSDPRPTTVPPSLQWDGRPLLAGEAGGSLCGSIQTLRWPLRLEGAPDPARRIEVAGRAELRGTSSLTFLPLANQARFTVAGAWQTPSYVGGDLPRQTTLDEDGFRAEWAAALPSRAIALGSECGSAISGGRSMGVSLLEAVPTYRMVNRASKYAMMFLVLAFTTYLLFELMAGVAIHVVQYGLLGLSVVLFPLLLLAIAEPAGFALAYAASTAMVMAQASLYTASVTGRRGLALIFAGVLAILFGFLYVVLSLESFALLVGAVALFVVLSAVMAVTRKVRWSA
jgi:inner membrane protein